MAEGGRNPDEELEVQQRQQSLSSSQEPIMNLDVTGAENSTARKVLTIGVNLGNLNIYTDGGETISGTGVEDASGENVDSASSLGTKTPPFFKDVPANVKQARMTEQDLTRMSRHIGSDWELIALELGIKQTDREKGISLASSPDLQMIKIFTKWVQANPGKTTRENFVKAMWACNSTCSIDWDGIEKVFNEMK